MDGSEQAKPKVSTRARSAHHLSRVSDCPGSDLELPDGGDKAVLPGKLNGADAPAVSTGLMVGGLIAGDNPVKPFGGRAPQRSNRSSEFHDLGHADGGDGTDFRKDPFGNMIVYIH